MKLLYSVLIIIFTVSVHSQVSEEWVKKVNGTSNSNDAARSSVIDPSGNIIVTGSVNNNGTQADIYTVKYSPSGSVLWSAVYNSPNNRNDIGMYITCDASGNIYIAGKSDSLENTPNYITLKYSTAGTLLWAKRYSGNGPGNSGDVVKGIVLDNSANVYITGTSIGVGTSYDIATLKYNTNGVLQWLVRYDSVQDEASSIAVDASSNIYIGGCSSMSGNLSLTLWKYNSSGIFQWHRNVPSASVNDVNSVRLAVDNSNNVIVAGTILTQSDILTRKYSGSGDLLWENIYNGPSNLTDGCTSMINDPAGNIVICGYTYISGSQVDALALKYSNSGSLIWSKSFNGIGFANDWANNLAADNNGNIYITGRSRGYSNTDQVFTTSYDPSGSLLWSRYYDGSADGNDAGNSIITDGSNNIYVSGTSAELNTGYELTLIKYTADSRHDIAAGPFINLPFQFFTNFNYKINVRFYNNGTFIEQNKPVKWYINSVIQNTEFITLYSGETDTLVRLWTPTAPGTYELKFISALSNDTNRFNDTVKTTVQVINRPSQTGTVKICRNSLNRVILSNSSAYDTININIPNSISVVDVNVKIDTVLYGWDSDLRFQLTHLSVTDTLILHRGGSGDNFIGTYLNDSASVMISSGTAPFTGTFRPDGPLFKFNTQSPNGNWILSVSSDAGGDTGLLKAWCLDIVYDYITNSGYGEIIPDKFSISQNYPNPFNPATSISFDIPVKTFVELKIFDILGREIKSLVNNIYQPGSYKIDFDASELPSGIYIYRINAGDFTESKKMVLIK